METRIEDIKGVRTRLIHFDNLNEYVEVARNHGPSMHDIQNGVDEPEKWAGGVNVEGAHKLAHDGYYPDAPTVEEVISAIESDLAESMENTFEAVYDVAGSAVDVGRYLAGDPECMMDAIPIRVMRTGRVIRVAVPFGYSANVREESVRRRGAAVMALLEILGALQIPVEIYGTFVVVPQARRGNAKTPEQTAYTVRLVGPDGIMDKGTVTYALSHPSMLRKLGFSVMEATIPEKEHRSYHMGSGYGRPDKTRVEHLEINAENAIVLPNITSMDQWTTEECVAWVRGQVERIQTMQA